MAASLGTGLLLAFTLPPWGWWPLVVPAVVAFDRLLAGAPVRTRALRGALVGLAWFSVGVAWMWALTPPGYLIAVGTWSVMTGLVAAAVPPGRWRWLALPGGLALLDATRTAWPFGGVPLSTVSLGQAASPLAPVVRLGGPFLLTGVVVVAGGAVALALRRDWVATGASVAFVAVVAALAAVAPAGHAVGTIDVALVQGGGPQGTRAISTPPGVVFQRHLEATAALEGPVDLVVWPESIVDLDGPVAEHLDDPQMVALRAVAARLDATVVSGIQEDLPDGRFVNGAIAVAPDGRVVDRMEKHIRVPFGEYVPYRSLLETVADLSEVPRDAVAGTGDVVLSTPAGELGVVVSWEVFFADRSDAAVREGAEVILNPTNGASYQGTILQTQQVAASRLRAMETGRWVLQSAPTGLSAVIGPDGTVHDRTGVSERAILRAAVERRQGETWAVRVGPLPALALAVGGLASAWAASQWWPGGRRRPPGRLTPPAPT